MFIFTTKTIFKNFEVLMEEHTEIFNEIRKKLKKDLHGEELSKIVKPYFEKFEKISVDFAPSSSVHRARPVAWIFVAADRRAVKMRS